MHRKRWRNTCPMVKHPCPMHAETLVHLQTAAAHAIARSRSRRLSQAHLQTHRSCAEAPLLRQRGCWMATWWASSVGIAYGGVWMLARTGVRTGCACFVFGRFDMHRSGKGVNCIALADVRPTCWCKTIALSMLAMVVRNEC